MNNSLSSNPHAGSAQGQSSAGDTIARLKAELDQALRDLAFLRKDYRILELENALREANAANARLRGVKPL